MLDNFGRDVKRMMWMLLGAGVLAGAGATAAIVYVIQRLRG